MLRNGTKARSKKKTHALRSACAEKGKSAWPYVSILGAELEPIEDNLAEGKSFRETVSRKAHARWKVHERRDDMLRILHANDTGRLPELIPIRYGRMLQSPFAFYRGAVAVMAADLAKTPTTGIRVQACGDCHLMNFGGFATPERSVIFDINDFDETLPGPWEWDLKRLVVSFILAARWIGLSDVQGREAAMAAARSYRTALREFTQMHPLEVWYARTSSDDFINAVPKRRQPAIRNRIAKAIKRSGSEIEFPKLTCMVGGLVAIHDTPPLIFHPKITSIPEFWAHIEKGFAAYRKTLPEELQTLLDQYRVVDGAMKVVGVGSVGRRCCILLLMSGTNEPLFLQFKEAVASVFEPHAGKSAHGHHGQRVVVGQRMIQPASDLFLGWVTVPTPKGGVEYYVRQLRDAKIKPAVETFDAELLCVYGTACGRVLAHGHAKTGNECKITGYLGKSDQFDQAMADFAVAYADQTEKDHAALKVAVKRGKIQVYEEQ